MKTLVISDVHLGNASGLDIYAGGGELAALLDAHHEPPVRVIFNGDTVDFLMNGDPLELTVERAVRQAEAIVASPDAAATFAALGRLLSAGGECIVRLGNHDIELALPEVQAVFRAALQADDVASRMQFVFGDAPMVVSYGGAQVLITHGDHCDPWNTVDYERLPSADGSAPRTSGRFAYPAGSRLVKTILNPLKTEHRLRFSDLLKPDFQGAVLTALAVEPAAVKEVFGMGTSRIMWQLFKDMRGGFAFDEGVEEQEDLGLGDLLEEIDLSPKERGLLKAVVDPNRMSFGVGGPELPLATRRKLIRKGLEMYARWHRTAAGDTGSKYFSLQPAPDELGEARRLAGKFGADVVLMGHTHAARWAEEQDVLYANTGTWIWLMRLPAPDASDEDWANYLEELDRNPTLEENAQVHARTERLLTVVTLEPALTGGVYVGMGEWVPGEGLTVLREARVQPGR